MPNTLKANDLVPEGTILFMDAYDWYYEEAQKNALARALSQMPFQEAMSDSKRATLELLSYRENPQAAKSLDGLYREKEREVFFRWCLRRGQIISYVRDPEDGSHLRLEPGDWIPFPKLLMLDLPTMFHSDFLDDSPLAGNPPTVVRGVRRPVFFYENEFETWIKHTFDYKKHAGGRPPGSGSLYSSDEPLLQEMRELIESKKAKSPTEAAGMVADKARGQSFEAKQTRLRKSYRKMFPLE